MSRETLRKAVVQKFNKAKGWSCKSFEELKEDISEEIKLGNRKSVRKLANEIINSLKIVDPAVGSGHFLVSVLNELIAIKSELRILVDTDFEPINNYTVEVVNDELIIYDEDGILYQYNYNNKESQRIQETIFHEKQTIIENCLFGVDINPNSVKICRLRLWIELLKNAYYLPTGQVGKNPTELETLPNIDINIKCGNSLVSRFDIDADIKQALKKSKWSIDSYRIAVDTYRNAESKEQKREMERLIADIKSDFRSEISLNDPKVKRLRKLSGELFQMTQQQQLFEMSKKEKAAWNKKVAQLTQDTKKLETEIAEIKNNKIFENAFEWRFEFPEVLNDEGDFAGFDVVIGNPPYVGLQSIKEDSESLSKLGYATYDKTGDLYVLFCERGNQILKSNGELSFIIPNKWMSSGYGKNLRHFLISNTNPYSIIDFEKVFVFDEAVVFVCILSLRNQPFNQVVNAVVINNKSEMLRFDEIFAERNIELSKFDSSGWQIITNEYDSINLKIESKGTLLKNWSGIGFFRGITTGLNDAYLINSVVKNRIIDEEPQSEIVIKKVLRGRNIKRYKYDYDENNLIFVPWHFPLHLDLSISNSSSLAEEAFINNYPKLYQHLNNFKSQLEKRNKEETGIRYEWYALQRYGSSYYQLFETEKIVWLEISDKANYAFDNNNMYLTNSAYFLSGHSLKYLLAVLNSKLCDFYFFQKTANIAGGRKRYTKQYVEQNPIPIITQSEQKPFIELVDKILSAKENNNDTFALETQIDQLVYQLYDLTEEEIKIIERE
jgi:hypothetical protein